MKKMISILIVLATLCLSFAGCGSKFANGQSKEINLYAATVYAEAGGESDDAKFAVANVINNRVGKGEWKSKTTFTDVIEQKGQFGGYGSSRYDRAMDYYKTGKCDNPLEQKAMDDSLSAVLRVLNGESDNTSGATFFMSPKEAQNWVDKDSYTAVDVPSVDCFCFFK